MSSSTTLSVLQAVPVEVVFSDVMSIDTSPLQHNLFTNGDSLIRWNLSITEDLSHEKNDVVHMVYRIGLIAELIGKTMTATQEYTCKIKQNCVHSYITVSD